MHNIIYCIQTVSSDREDMLRKGRTSQNVLVYMYVQCIVLLLIMHTVTLHVYTQMESSFSDVNVHISTEQSQTCLKFS